MKKIQIKNTETFILKCVIVFFILSLIPILLLGIYNVPGSDDYSYGAMAHQAWKNTHSYIQTLIASFRQSVDFYSRWQGTYGSCFLMSLNPGIISPNLSFLVPFIMIILCVSSTLLLFHEIFCHYFKCSRIPTITTLLFILTIYFQNVVSAKDCLYWYNGAIHYTGIQSLSFIMIYFASLLIRSQSKIKQLLLFLPLLVLSFLIGGGNLVTALQIAIIFVFAFIFFFLKKTPGAFRLILPFITFLFGFYLNITAPGNNVRSTVFDSLNPIKAIISSFLSAANYAIKWTDLITIVTFILILPLIYKMVTNSTYTFSKPLFIFVPSICLFSAMFTPSLYATGCVGADRQLNIIQLTYYLLLLINITYFLGYLQKNKANSPFVMSLNTILKTYSGTISLLCFCAICSIIIFTSDRTTYTSVSATRLFLNGEAKQYKEEYMERMEILEDDSISIAFVKPFTVHPTLLATDDDFTPNSENWLNIEGSKYFNKVAIILEE